MASHGKFSNYVMGCRCEACSDANRQRSREYYSANKDKVSGYDANRYARLKAANALTEARANRKYARWTEQEDALLLEQGATVESAISLKRTLISAHYRLKQIRKRDS